MSREATSKPGRRGRNVRRAALALLALLLLLVLAWVLLPAWFPWIFKPLAARESLHYANYKRLGYSRFALSDVTYSNSAFAFSARSATAFAPPNWIWQAYVHRNSNSGTFLLFQDWRLVLNEKSPARAQATPSTSSTWQEVSHARALLREIQQWVPEGELSNGVVVAKGREIKVPDARLHSGTVSGRIVVPEKNLSARVALDFRSPSELKLQLASAPSELSSLFVLQTSSAGLRFDGSNFWRGATFHVSGSFETNGVLPRAAAARGTLRHFPASELGLPEYRAVSGSLTGSWTEGHFAMDLAAQAEPTTAETNLPPASLELHAEGNTNAATIRLATLSADWLHAELSTNVTIFFHEPYLIAPARLHVVAQLDRQNFFPAKGNVDGIVDLAPAGQNYPRLDFHLRADALRYQQWLVNQVSARGELLWPRLQITEFHALLPEGSSASVNGSGDLKSKILASTHVAIRGPFLSRFLPRGTRFQDMSLEASLSGPVTNLQHQGSLSVHDLESAQTRPLDAQIKWAGLGSNLSRCALSLQSTNAAVNLSGSLKTIPGGAAIALDSFDLTTDAISLLQARAPARITVSRSVSRGLAATIDGLDLAGPGGAVAVDCHAQWPLAGRVNVSVKGLSSEIAVPFLKTPPPEVSVRQFGARADWTNGLLSFAARGSLYAAHFERPGLSNSLASYGPLALGLQLRADEQGLSISNLSVAGENSRVLDAHGFFPVTFCTTNPFVRFQYNRAIAFTARTDPKSAFWARFADVTGIEFSSPDLRTELSGTWDAPEGFVRLRAARMELPRLRSKLPGLSNLNFELGLNRGRAWLTNCQMLVQGQAVRLSGEMPLNAKFWRDLRDRRMPDLRKAEASLAINHAQVAAFVGLFPSLLSPQGELSVNVALKPGEKLEGDLAIQNARARPLPRIGPVRDINARFHIQDEVAELVSATANIGGAPVFAAGRGDLGGAEWLHGVPPPFHFTLRGTNVPLSREPSSILRANLDVLVQKTNAEAPLIAGTVTLTNSFFLSDLSALVPGKTAAPARRPPYFSIDDPSLADWRLAVHVAGDHALKARTTLFTGEAGLNLRLQGTLKEPLAIGDVKIDQGAIHLPFAALEIQQGFVTLTSEDPYQPRLQITAASRRFGYDVRMAVTGPARQPVIQFTSTPPLSSEQLLLMVTAGELPAGGYTLTPQQRAQTVAIFLGKDLLAKLGFGDSTVQRLTFTSGEDISEAGKPTYGIEYKLTRRWSLEGEYDRFNAFNAGLKWKVYSK